MCLGAATVVLRIAGDGGWMRESEYDQYDRTPSDASQR